MVVSDRHSVYVAGIALRHVCGARRVGYRAPEQVASGATSPVGGVRSNDTRKSGWSDFAARIPQGHETSQNQTLSMYKFSQAPRLPTEGVVLYGPKWTPAVKWSQQPQNARSELLRRGKHLHYIDKTPPKAIPYETITINSSHLI